ncbi:MAG TPA: cyclic nucleotide-binding domain-containing protein [Actinomycetota bacterium]|nr:cyclic nucleotide-binding domain-containing protein [Actinomycetota bacterium]
MANVKLDSVLAAVPLFDGLSKRHVKRLAGVADVAEFMADASIVREGDAGDAFYVVLAGQAKVTTNGKVVNRVMPGDYFGEISLLDGDVRTATVTSETPMTLLILERPRFLKLLREEPQMAMHLLQGLARQVRRTTRSLVG